jgi:hypothetical protein
MPGAPDIDMHIDLKVTYVKGRLDVLVDITGDKFPNLEAILVDETGKRRDLLSFETDGGAHTGPGRLFSDKREPMNALCPSFDLDAAGHFL